MEKPNKALEEKQHFLPSLFILIDELEHKNVKRPLKKMLKKKKCF
jgi:hypothetical protein